MKLTRITSWAVLALMCWSAAAAEVAIEVPLPWPERTAWHSMMRKAVKQVELGATDVEFAKLDALPQLPELNLLVLPWPGQTAEQATALRKAIEGRLAAALERAGYELIGLHDLGPIVAFSKLPVQTPRELGQRRIWVSTDLEAEMLKILGVGTPVVMPADDVAAGLDEDRLDTVIVPPLAVILGRWRRPLKHGLDLPLLRLNGVLAASRDGLDRLAPAARAALREALNEGYAEAAADQIRKNEEALKLLHRAGSGMIFFTPGGNTLLAWDEWAAAVAGRAVAGGRVGRELLQLRPGAAGAGQVTPATPVKQP